MHGAGGVDVAAGEGEGELRLHRYIRLKPSWQMVIASTAISFEFAFIDTPVYFEGHACLMLYVAIGDPS